jgi:hypothetical protein
MSRSDARFADEIRSVEPLPESSMLEVRQQLLASDVYAKHAREWADCVTNSSNVIVADNPIAQTEAQRSEYYAETAMRLAQLAGDPTTASIVFEDIRGYSTQDDGWLLEVTALDPDLQQLFSAERDTAVADLACRSSGTQAVRDEYGRLTQLAIGAR